MTYPSERLLSRLEGVRQTGGDKWIAKCPSHGDRSPSLAIRRVGDRLLVHCFAGCGALDVVHAVGLELSDLFDQPLDHQTLGGKRPPIDYKQLCIMSQYYALILMIFLEDVVAGKKSNPVDVEICRNAFAEFCKFARAEL